MFKNCALNLGRLGGEDSYGSWMPKVRGFVSGAEVQAGKRKEG